MLWNILKRWIEHDAEWWQFWYPQSGMEGGMLILGLVVLISIIAIIAFIF